MRFDPSIRAGGRDIDSLEAAERMLLERPEMVTRPQWAHAQKVLAEVAMRGGSAAAYEAVRLAAYVDKEEGVAEPAEKISN